MFFKCTNNTNGEVRCLGCFRIKSNKIQDNGDACLNKPSLSAHNMFINITQSTNGSSIEIRNHKDQPISHQCDLTSFYIHLQLVPFINQPPQLPTSPAKNTRNSRFLSTLISKRMLEATKRLTGIDLQTSLKEGGLSQVISVSSTLGIFFVSSKNGDIKNIPSPGAEWKSSQKV